jgi:hypothetical protein
MSKIITDSTITTKDTILGFEVTIYWRKVRSDYVLHKVNNDYFEKSGGIKIEGYELIDMDSSYSLPEPVALCLEKHGIKVDDTFLLL